MLIYRRIFTISLNHNLSCHDSIHDQTVTNLLSVNVTSDLDSKVPITLVWYHFNNPRLPFFFVIVFTDARPLSMTTTPVSLQTEA